MRQNLHIVPKIFCAKNIAHTFCYNFFLTLQDGIIIKIERKGHAVGKCHKVAFYIFFISVTHELFMFNIYFSIFHRLINIFHPFTVLPYK